MSNNTTEVKKRNLNGCVLIIIELDFQIQYIGYAT